MKTSICISMTSILLCVNLQGQNINTVAGGGFSGLGDGGPATSCQLDNPHGIGFDAAGNIYFSDGNASRVRKIDHSTGIVTTVAGNGGQGYNGTGIPATTAEIYSPWGLTVNAAGDIYFTDLMNNLIRKVSASTGLITNIAGKIPSSGPPTNRGYNGDGIPADTAKVFEPMGIALDASGNIYVADTYNNRVRKITASTGIITTIAGTGSNYYNGDGIAATSANIFFPTAVAVDASGNVYIADNNSYRVRKVSASTGLISTIAGNGGAGYSGDGGPATNAQVQPYAMAIDAVGNLYITEAQNSRVRKITASTGIITTIAGTGSNGYNGDGIPANTAQIANTSGIAVNAAGDVYISDSGNNRIRMISSAIPTGITTSNWSSTQASIFPNPFNTQARISFNEDQKDLVIKITDLTGREVKSVSFTGKEFTLEKGQLTEGIYFVQALSGGNFVINQKIAIQ